MRSLVRCAACVVALTLGIPAGAAQRPARRAARAGAPVLERNVRAHMAFLAGDALQGRASGGPFERVAAEYVASQFAQFGLEPGAADGEASSYVQRVPLAQERFVEAPVLRVEGAREFLYGRDFTIGRLSASAVSGPLQVLGEGATPASGAFVRIRSGAAGGAGAKGTRGMYTAFQAGAAGVIVDAPPDASGEAPAGPEALPPLPPGGASSPLMRPFAVVVLSPAAAAEFDSARPGAAVSFAGKTEPVPGASTWNVVGVLKGSDPTLASEAVVVGAHIDHLGVRPASGGDSVYNGADDDASGVTAVIELARAMASGPRPRRTVYFVGFGSEEEGGLGAEYFVEHSPVPLDRIVADIEFEMIGRPDPAVPGDALWLTGFERSDLGPELARRGARLVADPHPEQGFFQRSDNYALALRGVVAHTVSSFGLHADYHAPSDEVAKVDFAHMTRAIGSLVGPLRWLAGTRFRPRWAPGMAPTAGGGPAAGGR